MPITNQAESVDALGTAVGPFTHKETPRHVYQYDYKSSRQRLADGYMRGPETNFLANMNQAFA